MTAGLPGAGIGGLFYLLCALVMPFREAYRGLRGLEPGPRWGLVWRQAALALGILAGIASVGLCLEWLLALDPRIAVRLVGRTAAAAGEAPDVLRAAALFLGLGTLAVVLGGVEALRLASRRRTARARAAHIRRVRRERLGTDAGLKTVPET